MQELVTEYCWGAAWGRPGLTRRERSLINLGMLTALGRSHELRVHVRGAVANGCTRREIQEALLQAAIYCRRPGRDGGVPRRRGGDRGARGRRHQRARRRRRRGRARRPREERGRRRDATRSSRSATATLQRRKRDLFYRYEAYGEPDAEVEMAYYFWVLRVGARRSSSTRASPPRSAPGAGAPACCPPLDALRALGIEPQAVVDGYRHAPALRPHRQPRRVPARDARRPAPGARLLDRPLAARFQFASHVEAGEVALARGGRAAPAACALTDGVEEIFAGSHGAQRRRPFAGPAGDGRRGRGGDVVLASDAVHFYEEFELDRPFGVIADLGRDVRGLRPAAGARRSRGRRRSSRVTTRRSLARFPALDLQRTERCAGGMSEALGHRN